MDAWLSRMYSRLGGAYPLVVLNVLNLAALGLIPLALLFTVGYFGLDLDEWLLASLATDATHTVCVALAVAYSWPRLKPMVAWCKGNRDSTLVETAGNWAYGDFRRFIRSLFILLVVFEVPVVVIALVGQSGYATLENVVASGVGWLVVTALIAVVVIPALDYAARPIRKSLGRYDLVRTQTSGIAVVLTAGPLITIFLCCIAMSFASLDAASDGGGRLLRGFLLGAGLILLTALPLILVVFGGVVGPLRHLRSAHRAVGAGDLSQVEVLSADEIGELMASFNEMVANIGTRTDELRESRARLVSASDIARRQVERDLHDGAQQRLVLLNLKLGQARRDLANDPNAERVLSGLQDEAGQALAELRDLAHGIYPQVLTSDGLSGALAEAARHAAIPATFTGDGVGRFAPEIEAAVYFCCLEALQNASKYAGDGASVQVKLSETDGELRFEVADDGAGFDPASANGSAGLQNMADRIGALGGELRIVSRSGAGTSVAGTIPVVG